VSEFDGEEGNGFSDLGGWSGPILVLGFTRPETNKWLKMNENCFEDFPF